MAKQADINHSATLPIMRNKSEPFVRSISFHNPNEYTETPSHYSDGQIGTYVVSELNGKVNIENSSKSQNYQKPLYSSLSQNRPPQPPPYKEAIAKSTFFNGTGSKSNSINKSSINNGNITSSHIKNDYRPNTLLNSQNTHNTKMNNLTSDSPSISFLHHDTMNLIDLQQQTIKSQERVRSYFFRIILINPFFFRIFPT